MTTLYPYKLYKPSQTYSEIRATAREAVKAWRKRNPKKCREYKAKHKKRHPDVVRAWNKRYRDRNRKAINLRARERYRLTHPK